MRRFLFFLLTFLLFIQVNAKTRDNIVELIVLGEGTTEKESITDALKTATMQAFGSFVSSSTVIINDELVKDEIISVSSGNVIGYDLVEPISEKNGNFFATLKVKVSITKLTEFAQSKGCSLDFDGNLYVQQTKLKILQKKNAKKVMENFFWQHLPQIVDFYTPVVKGIYPSENERGGYNLIIEIKLERNEELIKKLDKAFYNTYKAVCPDAEYKTIETWLAFDGEFSEIFPYLGYPRKRWIEHQRWYNYNLDDDRLFSTSKQCIYIKYKATGEKECLGDEDYITGIQNGWDRKLEKHFDSNYNSYYVLTGGEYVLEKVFTESEMEKFKGIEVVRNYDEVFSKFKVRYDMY